MTGSQLLLLGLVVVAAIVAGYFIGRWSTEREIGARSARPNPLPGPDEIPDEAPARVPAPRQRGAPPPASAGGDGYDTAAAQQAGPAQATRPRPAPPPAAAGGNAADASGTAGEPRRAKRGPPPPAAAGVMGTGDAPKRDR